MTRDADLPKRPRAQEEMNTLSELMRAGGEPERTVVLPAAESEPRRGETPDSSSDSPSQDETGADLLEDEDFLSLETRKVSRLTLTLIALLILAIGFLLGVDAQRFFG